MARTEIWLRLMQCRRPLWRGDAEHGELAYLPVASLQINRTHLQEALALPRKR